MSGRPHNVALVTGATQNWSDLDRSPAGSSAAARHLVDDVLADARRVAVVGPHAVDLITGLADRDLELTYVTRSIPDAVTVGELLVDNPRVQVVCGDVAQVDGQGSYDAVIALADLSRVLSLEVEPASWATVFESVRGLLSDSGVMLLGIENELGLHRMATVRSRYTSSDDSSWSVTATFDRTRPRSAAAAAAVAGDAVVHLAFPQWSDASVFACHTDQGSAQFGTALDAAVLGAPAYRRVGADPSRISRAAVMSGQLAEYASGWVLEIRPSRPATDDRPTLVESTRDGGVAITTESADGLRRTENDESALLELPAEAVLFSEILLDRAADGDLSRLRREVRRWSQWVTDRADGGMLPARGADLRFDNTVVSGDEFALLAAARSDRPVDDARWDALGDFVGTLQARGARHPWPAATDAVTIVASLGAMIGLDVPDDTAALEQYVPTFADEGQSGDVAGLTAVVERLTATNAALAGRAQWFEQKLSTVERDLRVRTERHRAQLAAAVGQQEALRGSAEDLRRSITYRLGNVVIGPLRELRSRTKS